MAEILVLARDSQQPNGALRHKSYRRGDIVTIQDDGHAWGRMEGTPTFYKLRVSGPKAAIAVYDQNARDDALVTLRRRRFGLDMSQITLAELAQLDAGETLAMSDVRFRALVIDHVPTARARRDD